MTVPVVGSLARKPPWRYLPEIHASRLSFSGSMRPKLGLMILCILLFLSVIALLIPLVSKLYQSQFRTDLLFTEPVAEDSMGVLTEYVLHIWRDGGRSAASLAASSSGSSPTVFSPSGIAHLVSVLAFLGRAAFNNKNQEIMEHQSINNTIQFHVSEKHLYDDLRQKISNSDSNKNIHVKLANKTAEDRMIKEEGRMFEANDEHDKESLISITASHQVNLVFPYLKLTEEKFFLASQGASKKIVMYDIVGQAAVREVHGVRIVTIQDVNGLELTVVLSKDKESDRIDDVVTNIEQFLVKPDEKFLVKKFVRLRIPIISTEGVIQLGDIIRHLHSQTNLIGDEETRAQSYHPRPHLAVPGYAGSHQEQALAAGGGMQDLVKYIVSGAKANITHLASLKMSKVKNSGAYKLPAGTRIEETIVCDHRFVYAVHVHNNNNNSTSATSLPAILGVFQINLID